MLYVEGQLLRNHTVWLYRHLEYLLNYNVERRLKSIKPAILTTEMHFDKSRDLQKGYAGVHVTDGPGKPHLIHVEPSALKRVGPALVAHELVHAIGGNELDSEVAEALICLRTGHDPIITAPELEEFRRHPQGKYYHVVVNGRKFLYRNIVLPW